MNKTRKGVSGGNGVSGGGEPAAKKGRRPGPTGPSVAGGSPEARRLAAVLLEVLAGFRTPTDAAALLGVSLPRYYALETRALQGFVGACEPRPRGPRASPEREAARLRAEVERLQRSCTRNQALLRLSQRAIGVSPPPPKAAKASGKRPRRPVARALQAATKLKSETPIAKETGDAQAI